MRKLFFILISLVIYLGKAQEFKCNVTINAGSISGSNKQIFRTLEHSLEDFVNNNNWTEKHFQDHEKIKCDIILNIKSYNQKNAKIESELYFRSYRPVYNSDYQSLMLNLIDKNFSFSYREFEKLDFNLELFDNNLVSTIAYYLYIALAHDFESFQEGEGKNFFDKAKIIQSNASSNMKSWEANNKGEGKGDLIELLQSPDSKYYFKAIYTYHRLGLDKMANNLSLGKNSIIKSINYISKLKQENRDASLLIKIFFDAKADEIVQIFKQGPSVNTSFTVNELQKLAPNYGFKWDEIQGKRNKNRPNNRTNKTPFKMKEGNIDIN